MKNISIGIPDMQSDHCQARVGNAIKTIEGVKIRSVDAGMVTLTLEQDALREDVTQVIEKAGYTVAGIEDNG